MTENNYLYHYTTQAGLIGILDTNCLWATHYKFLNDYSELNVAKEVLLPHFNGHQYQKIVADFYDKYLNNIAETYITSFCTADNNPYQIDNGLLSQWRGYADNGGFCILFYRTQLETLLSNFFNEKKAEDKLPDNETASYFFMKDVIYNSQAILSKLAEDYILPLKNIPIDDNSVSKTFQLLIEIFSLLKNEGFEEEREVRIVSHLENKSRIERKFRERNGEQICYIELFGKNIVDTNGKKDRSQNIQLPIKKIIVGPHKDKEARATWLRIKLASIGRDDIEVTVSKIPFVGR